MHYLYVFRSPNGGYRKIGHTNIPYVRCRRLNTRNSLKEYGIWVNEYQRECPEPPCLAEYFAHQALKAYQCRGEYFARVPFDEARAAVDAAIDRAIRCLAVL